MNYPKLTNCSAEYVMRVLMKLGGFFLKSKSPKHYKITHRETGKGWMLPLKSPIKKGLMWDMVRNYLQALGYSEEVIFKFLKC